MRRYVLAVSTLVISAGVHGLGFGLGAGPTPAQIEGGAPGTIARLGNSFADMTQGTMSPVTAKPDATPTTEPVQTVTPVQTTAPVQATAPIPAEAIAPSKVAPVQTAKTPVVAAPAQMVRPVVKPVEKPIPKEPPKPPREQAKPDTKPTRKGGKAETRAGQADGQARGKDTQASRNKGSGNQAGNAAVSNYPGKVMRKLQRVRKRGRGRGRAVVGFSIAASGAVTKVWLMRSSGNAKLDAAAVKHVHRAAPFPPPPKGAQRKFRFDYIIK